MKRAAALLLALVMPALVVAGCARVPLRAGFSDVQRQVAERTGHEVCWNLGTADDEAVRAALDKLLAARLTPEGAVQVALLNNRRLQAVYEQLGIAQADLVQAGLRIVAWGFNGATPGPVVEACQGDQVRIYVTNNLPAQTTVHWHGVPLPCGMDGVDGLTQPPILPGETYRYEFIFPYSGTFMYHSHFDEMTQNGLGLVGMIVVHERERDRSRRPDRDFCIMLNEWAVDAGTARPNTVEMTDFNILTMNGHAMPGTEPLVAKLGDRVRMRFGNLSAMDHHPIHLHGYSFMITGTTGGWIPPAAQHTATTVLVQVGEVKVIELLANNPGDWIMHCHMTHHMMNQMGHNVPNLVGADTDGVDEKIERLIPGYMTMGTIGMMDMTKMGMPLPENSIPMLGASFQFGDSMMGGMATVFKVREGITSYGDPGWYSFPVGSMARAATQEELDADSIPSG